MNTSQLITVANALVEPGKGLLAADESGPTIAKRFREIDVESTEENRLAYRRLLFTTPEIERYLSGIILFDETIRQSASDGTPLPKVLSDKGVVPGIKVDKGAKPLAGFGEEKVTEGLDGLRERLAEYYELGARFAKWRSVIAIGEGMPTTACMEANAHALARYAALCQEADIVPIVEPEVLIDGEHTIEQCRQATAETWYHLYNQMHRQDVLLEGSLLKASMVLSGKACSEQASVEEVAEETVSLARELVPAAVPGIVFLSGGQSPVRATQHLDAMNRLGEQPWKLGFSYARALQEPVMQAWRGDDGNTEAAQNALFQRAKLNSEAMLGRYSSDMEEAA
ncbi:class I fructose-bisphosphate aldolase [Halofilum ochraceum]|uniref:class I fructose-bisphosphate aldolase n=1 Tax=Halofilum ochraceum TaxID=1611323 RepID=UPI0008336536|nr:class I fructose-bisphosphate aldolase [Halofilum ochraceum]